MPNGDSAQTQSRQKYNEYFRNRRKRKMDDKNKLNKKLCKLIDQNAELKAKHAALKREISTLEIFLTAFPFTIKPKTATQTPSPVFIHLGSLSHTAQTCSTHKVTGNDYAASARFFSYINHKKPIQTIKPNEIPIAPVMPHNVGGVNPYTNLGSGAGKSTFSQVRKKSSPAKRSIAPAIKKIGHTSSVNKSRQLAHFLLKKMIHRENNLLIRLNKPKKFYKNTPILGYKDHKQTNLKPNATMPP